MPNTSCRAVIRTLNWVPLPKRQKTKPFNNNNNKKFNKPKEADEQNCWESCTVCAMDGTATHVTDDCKVLIAEADKLKRQHAAGSQESRAKTKTMHHKMHHNLLEKDLNAMIDERIGAMTKGKKKEKSVTFASLKDARKYLEDNKNKEDSSSDEE